MMIHGMQKMTAMSVGRKAPTKYIWFVKTYSTASQSPGGGAVVGGVNSQVGLLPHGLGLMVVLTGPKESQSDGGSADTITVSQLVEHEVGFGVWTDSMVMVPTESQYSGGGAPGHSDEGAPVSVG